LSPAPGHVPWRGNADNGAGLRLDVIELSGERHGPHVAREKPNGGNKGLIYCNEQTRTGGFAWSGTAGD
jgi:hypothetical protein